MFKVDAHKFDVNHLVGTLPSDRSLQLRCNERLSYVASDRYVPIVIAGNAVDAEGAFKVILRSKTARDSLKVMLRDYQLAHNVVLQLFRNDRAKIDVPIITSQIIFSAVRDKAPEHDTGACAVYASLMCEFADAFGWRIQSRDYRLMHAERVSDVVLVGDLLNHLSAESLADQLAHVAKKITRDYMLGEQKGSKGDLQPTAFVPRLMYLFDDMSERMRLDTIHQAKIRDVLVILRRSILGTNTEEDRYGSYREMEHIQVLQRNATLVRYALNSEDAGVLGISPLDVRGVAQDFARQIDSLERIKRVNAADQSKLVRVTIINSHTNGGVVNYAIEYGRAAAPRTELVRTFDGSLDGMLVDVIDVSKHYQSMIPSIPVEPLQNLLRTTLGLGATGALKGLSNARGVGSMGALTIGDDDTRTALLTEVALCLLPSYADQLGFAFISDRPEVYRVLVGTNGGVVAVRDPVLALASAQGLVDVYERWVIDETLLRKGRFHGIIELPARVAVDALHVSCHAHKELDLVSTEQRVVPDTYLDDAGVALLSDAYLDEVVGALNAIVDLTVNSNSVQKLHLRAALVRLLADVYNSSLSWRAQVQRLIAKHEVQAAAEGRHSHVFTVDNTLLSATLYVEVFGSYLSNVAKVELSEALSRHLADSELIFALAQEIEA